MMTSSQKLIAALAEFDGLRYATEVMRTDGVGFDAVLSRRAVAMVKVIEAAREVVTAPETPAPPVARSKSQLLRFRHMGAKQFTCAFCGSIREIEIGAEFADDFARIAKMEDSGGHGYEVWRIAGRRFVPLEQADEAVRLARSQVKA